MLSRQLYDTVLPKKRQNSCHVRRFQHKFSRAHRQKVEHTEDDEWGRERKSEVWSMCQRRAHNGKLML